MGNFGAAFLPGENILAEGECQEAKLYQWLLVWKQGDPGGALGIFYMDCLTNAQQSSRFHPSPNTFRMIVITLGEVFLEYSPSFRATGTKACCSLWHSVSETGVVQAATQKAVLCKSPKWRLVHGKANQSPVTSSHLPIFTSRWLLWNKETWCAWVCLRWQNHTDGSS